MIKELRNQGLSIRAIRREIGHSRKTISKYLKSVKPPEYKPRQHKPGKLDPYKDYIRSRLKKYPLSAIRVFEEIQKDTREVIPCYVSLYTALRRL